MSLDVGGDEEDCGINIPYLAHENLAIKLPDIYWTMCLAHGSSCLFRDYTKTERGRGQERGRGRKRVRGERVSGDREKKKVMPTSAAHMQMEYLSFNQPKFGNTWTNAEDWSISVETLQFELIYEKINLYFVYSRLSAKNPHSLCKLNLWWQTLPGKIIFIRTKIFYIGLTCHYGKETGLYPGPQLIGCPFTIKDIYTNHCSDLKSSAILKYSNCGLE